MRVDTTNPRSAAATAGRPAAASGGADGPGEGEELAPEQARSEAARRAGEAVDRVSNRRRRQVHRRSRGRGAGPAAAPRNRVCRAYGAGEGVRVAAAFSLLGPLGRSLGRLAAERAQQVAEARCQDAFSDLERLAQTQGPRLAAFLQEHREVAIAAVAVGLRSAAMNVGVPLVSPADRMLAEAFVDQLIARLRSGEYTAVAQIGLGAGVSNVVGVSFEAHVGIYYSPGANGEPGETGFYAGGSKAWTVGFGGGASPQVMAGFLLGDPHEVLEGGGLVVPVQIGPFLFGMPVAVDRDATPPLRPGGLLFGAGVSGTDEEASVGIGLGGDWRFGSSPVHPAAD